MAATLVFARHAAPVSPGPLDEALWYARALSWAVLPGRTVSLGHGGATTVTAPPSAGPAAVPSGAGLGAHAGPAATSPACAVRWGRPVGDEAEGAMLQPTESTRPTTNVAGQRAATPGEPVRWGRSAAQPSPPVYPPHPPYPAYRAVGGGRRVRGCGPRDMHDMRDPHDACEPRDVRDAGGVRDLPDVRDSHVPAATTDPEVILRWWGAQPRRAVRLATGVRFDVLDVPGAAGARVLRRAERLGLPLGPVAATASGRVRFFVAPGVAEDLPAMLDWLDWSGIDLDLRAYGAGASVSAPSPWPATWLAPWPRPWESSRWLRAPAGSRLRCAGDAGPESLLRCDVRFADVTRLLSGLADACQQVRLLPAQRGGGGRD